MDDDDGDEEIESFDPNSGVVENGHHLLSHDDEQFDEAGEDDRLILS